MKNWIFLACIVSSLSLSAQASGSRPALFEAFVQTYTLDASQMRQLEQSQATWTDNLADLQALRSQQLDLYLAKVQALHTNTRATLRRLLYTEQRTQFDLAERQRRQAESERIKMLSNEGHSDNQIRLLMLEESF